MYRRKTTVIIVMCVMMLFMGIGYAILSTKLNINGNTAVTSTWKVEFSGISVASTTGGATSKSSSYSATTVNFEVDLVQPGDELTYNVNITNYGDIKAEVKGATYTATDNDAIYVKIKGIEKGTILESCEGLTTCPTKTLTITVGYNPGVEKDPSNKTKDISLTLQVGQYIAGNPTESGELIPEASESLVTKILSNNSALPDTNIDFAKSSSPSIYKESHATSTSSVSFTASTKYYFANTYTFDEATGYYSLAGDVVQEIWSSTMVQKYPYTCKSTSNNVKCTSFYKMTSYSSSTSGYGYYYSFTSSGYSTRSNGLGLYYTSTNTEDNKVTYYFRGSVENNYVSFAGFIWRIVRINEDGSIRVIKQDSIGNNSFNLHNTSFGYDTSQVGYMYGVADTKQKYGDVNGDGSITSDDVTAATALKGQSAFNSIETLLADVNFDDVVNDADITLITNAVNNSAINFASNATNKQRYTRAHANVVNSTIKTVVDAWYEANLTNYSSYLADSGFCGDRSIASTSKLWQTYDTALGYGTNTTFYGAYNRLNNDKSPQFKCPQSDDLYTTSTSIKGNKALTYPIGLITADEMVYAGAMFNYATNWNDDFYLANGTYFWTISPSHFSNYAYVGYAEHNKVIYHEAYYQNVGVRPVINLKSTVTVLSGDGTKTNPYIIN